MKISNKKKLVLVLLVAVFFVFFGNGRLKKNNLEYAMDIIAKCSKSVKVTDCYDEKISSLMKTYSMEDAFKVTSIVQEKGRNFPYCHVLGHKLASLEVKKDVLKWREVIARCPAGVCSNGCVHGAFQEKYRTDLGAFDTFEKSVNELRGVCDPRTDWNPSGLERGSCYHALGHLLMYITNADIHLSVKTCDDIAVKPDGDFSSVCYDGAFMQIYQPLEQEDRELILGKEVYKNTVDEFCDQFDGIKKESCVIESWPLYLEEIQSANGVNKFCGKLTGESMMACYTDVFYLAPIQFRFDQRFMMKYCSMFDVELEKMCAGTMAARILEIDYNNFEKAINFCEMFEYKQQVSCLESLVEYAKFSIFEQKDKYDGFCDLILERHKIDCNDSSRKNL